MLAIGSDDGLCLLEFSDRRMLPTQLQRIKNLFKEDTEPGELPIFAETERQLGLYFDGLLDRFALPLLLDGSSFQKRVWQRLLGIPAGQTVSYNQMAVELGKPNGQRAVGRANGDNRIAIIVPCHRVIRADGNLCGYGGGLRRKEWLLRHEATHWGNSSQMALELTLAN